MSDPRVPLYGDRGHVFVGSWPYHMYVEYQFPAETRHSLPVVMFHGGAVTGSLYWSTPDGRKGWAHHFVDAGWEVYVVDWPGHGRSGFPLDFHAMPYQRVIDAGVELLHKLGSSIVLTGSMSGPVGWKLGELTPQNVSAIISWAPGPPANLQDVNERPAVDSKMPAVYSNPIDMVPLYAAGSLFPKDSIEEYHMLHVPESAMMMNQRRNRDGTGVYVEDIESLRAIPKLILTSENDPGHPRQLDERTADFVSAEFVYLPEAGMPGHSHEMMLDHKNEELSEFMISWLDAEGIGHV